MSELRRRLAGLALLSALATSAAALERPESANVAQNYLLFCGGCHGDAGHGVAHKVPVLNGAIGRFLRIEGGREFLLRVPGVANSQLSDGALADVMNLCVAKFAGDQREGFRPYTALDIAQARRQPLLAVQAMRHALLRKAGASDAELARDY